MNKIKRIVHSTLGKALFLCAFALTLLGGTSAAFYSRAYGSAENTELGQNNLIYTPINCVNTPGFPAIGIIPQGINNHSQIVGGYLDGRLLPHGLLQNSPGVCQSIDYPSNGIQTLIGTAALGINNHGQVVGIYIIDVSTIPNIVDPRNHGFLLTGGNYEPIDFPGAKQTNAFGINDHGVIAGNYIDNLNRVHGFIRSTNGQYTSINVDNDLETSVLSINNSGHLVGAYAKKDTTFEAGPIHGFLKAGSTTTKFDNPDSIFSTAAYGINNCGQIVGRYTHTTGKEYGFLRENGLFTDIIPTQENPVRPFNIAYDINDLGQIVVSAVDEQMGIFNGYLTSVASPCQ